VVVGDAVGTSVLLVVGTAWVFRRVVVGVGSVGEEGVVVEGPLPREEGVGVLVIEVAGDVEAKVDAE